jgi:hypothetical protein
VRRTLAVGLILFGLSVGVVRVALVQDKTLTRSSQNVFRGAADPPYGQSHTQVEPDSFAWGAKIVAAFQSWRIVDGGAAALDWATSADGGVHWRSGTLPLGDYFAASDPVVAFDALHHVWLVSGIGFRGRHFEVFVDRSPDGLKWTGPVVAADDVAEDHDKEWVGCDNGARSPFRGRCYLAYVDTVHWLLGISTSVDGGLTWSQPLHLQPGVGGSTFSGPMPVLRPNGDLVVPYSYFAPINGENRVAAVISRDGGATFSQPVRIAALSAADTVDALRAPALPSATVDASGKLYVAWQDGRFRSGDGENDIVISTSPDGTRWTEPARIALPNTATYVLPAVAVDPATSGKSAHLAVVYYSMHLSPGCAVYVPGCYEQIDAWLVDSKNGGRIWAVPRKLNGQSMQLDWLAETTLGAMLGDYVSVSYVRGRPIPVLALAGRPTAAGHNESIFTCRLNAPVPRAQTKVTSPCRRPSP